MTFSLNDKQLLKISFVLALTNPEPKQTPFSVFMKRGYFLSWKFVLLSHQTRPRNLDEIFPIECLLVFTSELTLRFPK